MSSSTVSSNVKIGPVTSEIKWVIKAPFWVRQQKSANLMEYLTNYWTDLYERFNVGRRMYGKYKTYISFAVVKGTLLLQPINFGGFLQTSKLTVFTLCSRIPKRNAPSPFGYSYTNCSTSYKKMVKIGRNWKLYCDSAEIWRSFRNGLEDCNFDFRTVICNHRCTSCRNLVRFSSVTPEFKT